MTRARTGYQIMRERTTEALRAEMGMPRYRKRRDAAEPRVVKALLEGGASVVRIDTPVDLIVGWRGRTYLVEVKTAGTRYGRGLAEGQQAFAESWRGGQVIVLRTVDDVSEFLRRM